MDSFWRDVTLAIRRLTHQPTFTITAVLTIALGIGANTAVFSVLDVVLLRPLPFRDPGGLVELQTAARSGGFLSSQRADAFPEWRRYTDLFSSFEGYTPQTLVMIEGDEPIRIDTFRVTGGLMRMLGVPARFGRILDDGGAKTESNTIVLSDSLWRQRFGGDPSIVGRTIRMDSGMYDVIGVMPPWFRFPRSSTQAWTLLDLAATPTGPTPPRPPMYGTLARLAPGVTPALAQARVETLTPAFKSMMPPGDGWTLRVSPFGEMRANSAPRRGLWLIAGAVSLVLLIACANVANLLLARGASRGRELAVRAAMGASRARLIREILAESLLLSAAGGLAGLAIAGWGVSALARLVPRELTFLTLGEFNIDTRVLIFAFAATMVAGLTFGLVPAIRSTRDDLHDVLRTGGRTAAGNRQQRRLGRLVVIGELALSVVLLAGAGLLVRTLANLTRTDPGFDTGNLVGFTIDLPAWRYQTTEATGQFWSAVTQRVEGLPGLQGVTVAPSLPPGGGGISFDLRIEAEGNPDIIADPNVLLPESTVQPNYFSVMRIPLLAGRAFTREDATAKPMPVIVNEAMARRLWPKGSAVGGRVRFDSDQPWRQVIGVAGTVYQFDRTNRNLMAIYNPSGEREGRFRTLVVRSAGDVTARVADIRGVIRAIDPALSIFRIETPAQSYAEFRSAPRFYALLLAVFATTGVLLAAIGLYGVMAYSTAQRTSEFGIRVALGAEPGDVIKMVLAQGMTLAAAGLIVGVAGAGAATVTMSRLLVGVTPHDPATFAIVAATLALVTLAACAIPARRALRVDPVVALRQE